MGATPTFQVVGVYPVDGVESCYLIEAIVHGASARPDFAAVTQPALGAQPSDWQVPYSEKLLDSDGITAVSDLFLTSPSDWPSHARIAFFFHDLDTGRQLITPFGEVELPAPTVRPSRLKWFDYEPPC